MTCLVEELRHVVNCTFQSASGARNDNRNV